MPANARVEIHYGPYEACGIVDHRTARLEGMQKILQCDGHRTELQCIKDWNVVELWVNGELVFNCDIRQLEYGGDGQLDELCAQALKAVRKAF
ncbi:UPF0728 protein-like [Babylonia areolata]|uniref:UPF0728 protein-like n=1 Tax=Babylonia areolata TaxID=304850 RepID=UPI003FD32846